MKLTSGCLPLAQADPVLDVEGWLRRDPDMAQPTAVILVVGLNQSLIGDQAPKLRAFAAQGTVRRIAPVLPAVTCSVQASMLTGQMPARHGIVGNGWYDRNLAEVHFWKQSNRLVEAEKVWETARQRDSSVTCANLFWWFNMYSTVDQSVTPRPIYKADGRKKPDIYTQPPELREQLQAALGTFPLFHFWGPGASIASSRWIAEAAIYVHGRFRPTLSLVYLPHLDYALQKYGPGDARVNDQVRQIDQVAGRLIDYFHQQQVRPIIVSEYGIEPVGQAVALNRIFREASLLQVRREEGLELLDPGASDAFALADHQVAHVYVRDRGQIDRISRICVATGGVEQVLDRAAQKAVGLDHRRGGDLVAVAAPGFWFSYAYWLDDACAPDFARTVDIHRKPGYDPLELFLRPGCCIKAQLAWKLLQRRLGVRTLLDVIPLDTNLVRGSHGRIGQDPAFQPVLITQGAEERQEPVPCTAVREVILEHLFGRAAPG